MSFEKIVGNEKVKIFLDKQIKENRLVHSYLFVGIEGIGKTYLAKEFAKKVLCINKENTEDCISCIKWDSNNHPDFYEIEPEEKKSIKIEQIRQMQEKISEKPITSEKKVYIIKDSETMTTEAQNCLLKTLEEPPEYATIILITSNESKLLNTIKSRCMKISFDRIEDELIEKKVKEILQIEPLKDLIIRSEGSIKKAIDLHEEKDLYEQIDRILKNIEQKDLITNLNDSEILYKEKETIQEILEYIIVSLFHTKEKRKLNCIKYVEETKKRILSNSNYDMCIDYLLMKIWEEINEKYSRSSI